MLKGLSGALQVVTALVTTQQLNGTTLTAELQIREGGRRSRTFDERETAAIRDYLAMIQAASGDTLSGILGVLRGLSSIFYPTEDAKYTGILGYYRQSMPASLVATNSRDSRSRVPTMTDHRPLTHDQRLWTRLRAKRSGEARRSPLGLHRGRRRI
jgi:hypothetical protein